MMAEVVTYTYRITLVVSSGMDVVCVGLYYQIISSSNRTIEPPVSVDTEMWANYAVRLTDPCSTSFPPFPPARLP